MLLYVLPIENVAESGLGAMERFAGQRFAFETRRLDPMPLPAAAHDPQRDQYEASTLLRAALDSRPADATRLLAVTERDLFIPMLTFVFGQAQIDGAAALLSLARLRQEFYGLPPRHDLFEARIRKETLHELGHTFGLYHCTDARCAMTLSINVAGIDTKHDRLCSTCSVQLDDRIADLRQATGASKE